MTNWWPTKGANRRQRLINVWLWPFSYRSARIPAASLEETRSLSPLPTRFLTVRSGHETSFRKGIKNEARLLNIPRRVTTLFPRVSVVGLKRTAQVADLPPTLCRVLFICGPIRTETVKNLQKYYDGGTSRREIIFVDLTLTLPALYIHIYSYRNRSNDRSGNKGHIFANCM